MKTIRKNLLNAIGMASLLALAGLLSAACAGPFEPAPETNAPEGYVRITIAPDALARTMLPNALQLYFKLEFDNGSGVITTETLGGALEKTVALLPGTYDLAVLGYSSPYEAENGGTPVVNGAAASFPVDTGTNPGVEVALTAAQTGTGTLRYTLTYPTNPAVSGGRIYVEQLGGSYTKLIVPVISSYSGTQTSTGTLPDLVSGYYQVIVYLSNGRTAIKSDLAHIYDGLETDANFVFDLSSFADVADLSPLNTAIAAAKAAASADLRISPDGTGVTAGHTWVPQADLDTLNDAIAAAEIITANYGAGLTSTAANTAATALDTAVATFNLACATGTYIPGADLGLYVNDVLEPTAGTTLGTALDWLKDNAVADTDYTVLLGDDEILPPWILGGSASANTVFSGLTGVTLTLKGDTAERVIQLSGQGNLFRVNSGVTLILDQNITLRGRSDNNTSLVYVYDSTLEMNAGAKIIGNTASSEGGGVFVAYGTVTMGGGEISGNTASASATAYGGGVYISSGTFTMNGGKISGNTASSYTAGYSNNGGGVYISGGTFTMNSGEISDNTATSGGPSYGGGVYISSGAFTMNSGKISSNNNTAASGYSSPGGGVYISGGTFTMNSGEISDNTATSGGGVYVNRGTVTMSNGEISGNTASSSGGGVYVNFNGSNQGIFAMSGSGRVAQNNPVYLEGNAAAITIDGALDGTGSVAFIEVPADPAWIGREVIKKSSSFVGTLPVDRFGFTGPWEADSESRLLPKTVSLGFGETRSAFINRGGVHLYRFTPAFNKSYSITHYTREEYGYYYSNVYASAAWADGGGVLLNRSSYYSNDTPPSFVADRTGVDIIIMVDSFPYYSDGLGYAGVYSVNYNELD
jgi:hypothetical protein